MRDVDLLSAGHTSGQKLFAATIRDAGEAILRCDLDGGQVPDHYCYRGTPSYCLDCTGNYTLARPHSGYQAGFVDRGNAGRVSAPEDVFRQLLLRSVVVSSKRGHLQRFARLNRDGLSNRYASQYRVQPEALAANREADNQ